MKAAAALVAVALLTGYILRSWTWLFTLPANLTESTFLKNALAALVTAYLGTLLSFAELLIYRRAPAGAYAGLDRLTEPLYALFSGFESFRIPSPLRACLFYLYFVPLFSLFVNLTAISAFFWSFFPRIGDFATRLMPHALLEVPAMLGSIALGLAIAHTLRGAAVHGVEAFEREIRTLLRRPEFALPMLLILVLLYFAALLESG